MIQLMKSTSWFTSLMLIFGIAFSAPTLAAKANTAVKLRIKQLTDGEGPEIVGQLFRYQVTLDSTRDGCRKRRTVVIYHDENGNKKFDEAEFTIGGGLTNRKRGRLRVITQIGPPYGDRVGAIVAPTGKCRRGKASRVFHFGTPP